MSCYFRLERGKERGWEKEVNGSRKRFFNGSRSRAQPPTVVFSSAGLWKFLGFDFETFQLKDKKKIKKRVVGCWPVILPALMFTFLFRGSLTFRIYKHLYTYTQGTSVLNFYVFIFRAFLLLRWPDSEQKTPARAQNPQQAKRRSGWLVRSGRAGQARIARAPGNRP